MIRIQYERTIKICSHSTLNVTYFCYAINSLTISHILELFPYSIPFYVQKSVLYQKTVEESRENSLITCKTNSTNFMNLFLI